MLKPEMQKNIFDDVTLWYSISIRDTETLFIEILNKQNKNIIVGLIYRPPGNPIDIFLDDLDASHTVDGKQTHIFDGGL